MAGAEQVYEIKFNALSTREEPFDRILVAAESVGPLVVNPWEVVDFKLDTGNRGPSCEDLNEATQGMCGREPLHDSCAFGDVFRALPQCDAPGSRQWRAQAADQ